MQNYAIRQSPPSMTYLLARQAEEAELHEAEPSQALPRTPPQERRPPTPSTLRPPRRHTRSFREPQTPQERQDLSWMPPPMVQGTMTAHESLQYVVDHAPETLHYGQTRPMLRTPDGRFTYSFFDNLNADVCVVLTARIQDLRVALSQVPDSVLAQVLQAGDYLRPDTPPTPDA